MVYQAERTGKHIIFLLANAIPNGSQSIGPNDYLDDLKTAIQNVKNIGFTNMEIIQNPVTPENVRDVHPSQAGYDQQAQALAIPVSNAVRNAARQQRLCQLYIGFLNRVVESGGGDYWLNQMNSFGEEFVAERIYSLLLGAAREPLTGAALIVRYYQNLFGRTPDAEGLDYWNARRQSVGNGALLLEILTAAEKANPNAVRVLTQKVNISMTYGFILRRPSINSWWATIIMSGALTQLICYPTALVASPNMLPVQLWTGASYGEANQYGYAQGTNRSGAQAIPKCVTIREGQDS